MIILLHNVSLNEKKGKKRNKLINNQPVSAVYMAIRWNLNKYIFFEEVKPDSASLAQRDR